MIRTTFLTSLIALCLICLRVEGFISPARFGVVRMDYHASSVRLQGESQDDQQERLRKMGYSDKELERRSSSGDKQENVNVQEVDVDAFTLTAVGFALIAANFFLFANLGDGGIAGIVARIQNTLNS